MSSKRQKASRYFIQVLRPMLRQLDETRSKPKQASPKVMQEILNAVKAKPETPKGTVQFRLPQKMG